MLRIRGCLYIASCLIFIVSSVSAAGDDERKHGGEQKRFDSREQRVERREQFRQEMQNKFKKEEIPQREFFPRSKDRSPAHERIREERFENKKEHHEMREVKPETKSEIKAKAKSSHRLERKDFKERKVIWKDRARVVRDRFHNERRRAHIFDNEFWIGFRRHHKHWYFDDRFVWGAAVTWPAVSLWFPWRWSAPIYYYYADGGAIYYGEGQDFSYLTPLDSAEFVLEARRIANAQMPLSTDQSQWMPLGMFAIAKEGREPTEFLSLAVNKEGFISGAYQNTETGESAEVRGSVDQKSQRAAWRFVNKDWPIMESGIYNLTREESSLLVHFSEQRTESRLIVRLEDK